MYRQFALCDIKPRSNSPCRLRDQISVINISSKLRGQPIQCGIPHITETLVKNRKNSNARPSGEIYTLDLILLPLLFGRVFSPKYTMFLPSFKRRDFLLVKKIGGDSQFPIINVTDLRGQVRLFMTVNRIHVSSIVCLPTILFYLCYRISYNIELR